MSTTMREVIPSGNEYIAVATVEAFQGTAENVFWANIIGAPSLFPPEAHNHAADSWLLNIINPINTKLSTIEDNANYYVHPADHAATMITEDADHRFVTDTLIAAWNGKAEISDIESAVAALVGSAPETLDTITEIATALQNNPDAISELFTAVGLRATQADFDSHTGDSSLHVTQSILDRIANMEDYATADQTAAEIEALFDAYYSGDSWRTGGGESMLSADPDAVVKATTDSFATVLANAITGLSTHNYGSRTVVIQLANGTHNMGDDVFELLGQFNGRVVIEAATSISSAGTNQNAEIVLTGSGYFKMLNGNLNIDFSCIKVTVQATHQLVPFNLDGNINFTSYRCCWDLSAADAEATVLFIAGCHVASYDDYFIGSATQVTNFVKFARGGSEAMGGQVQIFNAHYSTTPFTNAVNGKGTLAISNSTGAFTNITTNNAIDVSANDGGSGVNVPVMSSGSVSNIADTTADFVSEFNRAGTIYWAVLPTASSVPTIAEIAAGTGATDYGSAATSGLTEETENITGLTAETAYDLYYYGIDNLGNYTPVYVTTEFTTESGFCTEYQAVYDAMTNKPDETNATYQNALVESLVDGGYWARMDLCYVPAIHTNTGGEALINWINPGTYNLTDPSSTSPTWTQYQGFSGDGASDYLSTNYIPATNANNIAVNSCSIGVYERADYNENTRIVGLQEGANLLELRPRSSGSQSAAINSGGWNTQTVASSQGFHLATRRASQDIENYYNGSSIGSDVDDSTSIPGTNPLIILATSDDGVAESFSNGELAFFMLMDAVSDAEALAINTIIETYMNAIGTGVQS